MNSLGKSLGYWGWNEHYKVCFDPPPIYFYLYVKDKLSKTSIYFTWDQTQLFGLAIMDHSLVNNSLVNLSGLDEEYKIIQLPVNGEGQGGVPHKTFTTTFLYVFFNITNHS